jgi:hypothetical protein
MQLEDVLWDFPDLQAHKPSRRIQYQGEGFTRAIIARYCSPPYRSSQTGSQAILQKIEEDVARQQV